VFSLPPLCITRRKVSVFHIEAKNRGGFLCGEGVFDQLTTPTQNTNLENARNSFITGKYSRNSSSSNKAEQHLNLKKEKRRE
jgi:hypothetical protein